MDSFMESLNRLKAVHEQEVLGLQNKLLELNSERCRDAQRAEELCTKNRQLREQQKALKDNVRVLENRLRAGLCDRCTVTQELARKRQQEFESSLLQNLQHIFILTNEMTRLQEENESLKEEVTRLQGLGPKPPCREGAPDATSPPTRTSPGARKATAEKLPGEEAEDHPPEKLAYRMSPGAKVSPRASPAEPRAPDVSPQRIANQLHTTIAVVRPGSRACSTDRSSASGTPPALSSPPSPPHEHGLPLDSFPRASRPSAVTCESLKHSLQADRLCLLNRRLALHLRNPHSSPRGPATAPGGLPNQGLKAGEAEAWEKTSGLLGLSGTLVDMRDPRLEGALSLLLARQADGARLRGPHRPGETLPSPPVGSDSEGPEGEVARATLPGKQHPRPTGTGSPRAKEARTTQDDVPDKPLDLSEWGRGRDAPTSTGRPGPPSPRAAHAPSPEPPQGAEPPAQSGPWRRSNGTKGTRAPEPEEPRTPEPLPGLQPSLLSPGADESRERPKPSPHPQRPDTEGHPELSKPEAQPQVSDGPDTPDALDNEGGLSPEEASPSTPGEAPRCFCTTEPRQGRPPKRKQAPSSDQWEKASKKLS